MTTPKEAVQSALNNIDDYIFTCGTRFGDTTKEQGKRVIDKKTIQFALEYLLAAVEGRSTIQCEFCNGEGRYKNPDALTGPDEPLYFSCYCDASELQPTEKMLQQFMKGFEE